MQSESMGSNGGSAFLHSHTHSVAQMVPRMIYDASEWVCAIQNNAKAVHLAYNAINATRHAN